MLKQGTKPGKVLASGSKVKLTVGKKQRNRQVGPLHRPGRLPQRGGRPVSYHGSATN